MEKGQLLDWLMKNLPAYGDGKPTYTDGKYSGLRIYVEDGRVKGFGVYETVFRVDERGFVELSYPPHDLETAEKALEREGFREGSDYRLVGEYFREGGSLYYRVRVVVPVLEKAIKAKEAIERATIQLPPQQPA